MLFSSSKREIIVKKNLYIVFDLSEWMFWYWIGYSLLIIEPRKGGRGCMFWSRKDSSTLLYYWKYLELKFKEMIMTTDAYFIAQKKKKLSSRNIPGMSLAHSWFELNWIDQNWPCPQILLYFKWNITTLCRFQNSFIFFVISTRFSFIDG